MISSWAREKLNDPALIAERDKWFDCLGALFSHTPNEYNRNWAFTLSGRGAVPLGGFAERFAVSADDLMGELKWLNAAAAHYDGETALRRYKRFAQMMASAQRVTPTQKGAVLELSPQGYLQPEAFMEETLERLALIADDRYDGFSPLCTDYDPYGVHFIDKLLGANVYYQAGQWYADYLKTPIGALQPPDLDRCETWALEKRAAQAFLDARVALPLFGMPTLSSPLNILVNLYGQEALIAMLEDEAAVRHDLKVISDLIRYLHRWYREHIPLDQLQPIVPEGRTQPPGFGQICGCTTQLLSEKLYREFIMPLDDQLLGDWPHGGMIHLCGGHTQHIPAFRDMPHLRAIQVNDRAAGDLRAYYEELRPDQIIYLNPCPEMSVEEAMKITGGDRLVLVGVTKPPARPS